MAHVIHATNTNIFLSTVLTFCSLGGWQWSLYAAWVWLLSCHDTL